jgi:hypothetical protein
VLVLGLLAAGRCFGVSVRGLSSHLLTFEFLCQFTLKPLLFSGFEKKRVSLHFLNNAFLLDLSLETAKSALNGFSLENPNFCQNVPPLILRLRCEYEWLVLQKATRLSDMMPAETDH